MILLDEVNAPEDLELVYFYSFDGFKKPLTEIGVDDYSLVIDKEGDTNNTLNAAMARGFKDSCEADSKNHFGIRMADMLAGLLSKMMYALNEQLVRANDNRKPEKS